MGGMNMFCISKIIKFLIKMFLVMLVFYAIFYAVTLFSWSDKHTSSDISNYNNLLNEVKNADEYMPSIEDFGAYDSLNISRKTTHSFMWNPVETVSIVVKYESSKFDEEKQKIYANYSFLTYTTDSMLDINACVNGYDIMIVEMCDDYPKSFLAIGINEETHSIAYMFNYDFDIDTIKDLDDYIEKYYVL